jgi:Holliday junction resolvase RusA-like endonuclease
MTETQNPIKISIEHQHSVQHGHKQWCDVSVPLPQSLAFSLEQLSLVVSKDDSDTTKTIDALCQIIAYWPDNSIKWLKLTYQYCHQPRLYLNITKLQTNTSDAATHTSIEATDIRDVIDVTDSYSYKGGANTLALSVANNRLEILDDNNQAILSLDANDLITGRNTILPLENCLLRRGIWSISTILEKTAKLTNVVCQKTLDPKLIEVSEVTPLCLAL